MAVIPIIPLFFFRIIYVLEILLNILLLPLTLLPNVQLLPPGIITTSHFRLGRQLDYQQSKYETSYCFSYDNSTNCTCNNITLSDESKQILIILHNEKHELECALNLSIAQVKKGQLTFKKSSSIASLDKIWVTSLKEEKHVELGVGDAIKTSDALRLTFRPSSQRKLNQKDITFKLDYQPVESAPLL